MIMRKKNDLLRVKYFVVFAFVILLTTAACKKENNKIPILLTINSINTEHKTATIKGEITDIGHGVVTHGHCWSRDSMPTVDDQASVFGELKQPGEFTTQVSNLQAGVYYARAYASDGNSIYYSNNQKFEIQPYKDVWKTSGELPALKRLGAVAFAIGTKVYIGTGDAGQDLQDDFWEYDLVTQTWAQKMFVPGDGDKSGKRKDAVGFAIRGKGYVGLGENVTGFLNDFWEYDPTQDDWDRMSDFGGGHRTKATAFVLNNLGYIVGGNGGYYNDILKNDAWQYDPTAEGSPRVAWLKINDMKLEPVCNAVAFTMDGKGFVGLGRTTDGLSKEFSFYDPQDGNWQEFIYEFPGTPRKDAVGFGFDTTAYVGLGIDENGYTKDFYSLHLYDNWEKLNDFSGSARHGAIAVKVLENMNIGYVGLGLDANGKQRDFFIYYPPTF